MGFGDLEAAVTQVIFLINVILLLALNALTLDHVFINFRVVLFLNNLSVVSLLFQELGVDSFNNVIVVFVVEQGYVEQFFEMFLIAVAVVVELLLPHFVHVDGHFQQPAADVEDYALTLLAVGLDLLLLCAFHEVFHLVFVLLESFQAQTSEVQDDNKI